MIYWPWVLKSMYTLDLCPDWKFLQIIISLTNCNPHDRNKNNSVVKFSMTSNF